MANIFTVLIAISGIAFAISSIVTPWISVPIAIICCVISPFFGHRLGEACIPGGIESRKALNARIAKRKRKEFLKNNREAVGFQYFKTTFLIAGHVANADGAVCSAEQRLLQERFVSLGLDSEQIAKATAYFKLGQSPDFNVGVALDEFMELCKYVPELCKSLLTTQFSFADANGEICMAEFKVINHVAKRLDLYKQFNDLLAEYQLRAQEHAEQLAWEKMQERRRQRDKKRSDAEKERINKNNKTANRKVALALAVLGLQKNASITEMKRAYRAMIKRHHPDRLLANGYPEELLAEATMRSAEINKAYKVLKTHYRFR
ncbi:MAG: DnaJ domain-containing protein [Gammaproteobacteria bacterium]|nr:DnaJ domain-containing protein [Gammaproteobacteria bacterium]